MGGCGRGEFTAWPGCVEVEVEAAAGVPERLGTAARWEVGLGGGGGGGGGGPVVIGDAGVEGMGAALGMPGVGDDV